MTFEDLGPFDSVLDVGGHTGEFAEMARRTWPGALITSFEPVPPISKLNRLLASGRWWVEECAISDRAGEAPMLVCLNQPVASTMQRPGTSRREKFGVVDEFEEITVRTRLLDEFAACVSGRCLVKIDVEGHELAVIYGGRGVLDVAQTVVVEVNQDPDIFLGAPTPDTIDHELRLRGLFFHGVLAVQADPSGDVVQFDGAWTRC